MINSERNLTNLVRQEQLKSNQNNAKPTLPHQQYAATQKIQTTTINCMAMMII